MSGLTQKSMLLLLDQGGGEEGGVPVYIVYYTVDTFLSYFGLLYEK